MHMINIYDLCNPSVVSFLCSQNLYWLYAIVATIGISLVSLIGVFALSMRVKTIEKVLLFLVAFSAGTMLGSSFFHLLPESLEKLPAQLTFQLAFLSLVVFFLIEKVLHWHHCHEADCHTHSIGYMNLFGDGLHNFIDGLLIAATFSVSIPLGIATTLAVIAHEIPQEIGDFGVLLHSGFSKKKALLFNLISAFAAVIGAITGILLLEQVASLSAYLIPIAAGSFLYIGAADLLPELRKETNRSRLIGLVFVFLLGAGIMQGLQLISPHAHDEAGHEINEETHKNAHDEHIDEQSHSEDALHTEDALHSKEHTGDYGHDLHL